MLLSVRDDEGILEPSSIIVGGLKTFEESLLCHTKDPGLERESGRVTDYPQGSVFQQEKPKVCVSWLLMDVNTAHTILLKKVIFVRP